MNKEKVMFELLMKTDPLQSLPQAGGMGASKSWARTIGWGAVCHFLFT